MRHSRILSEGSWYHVYAKINRAECIFDNKGIKDLFLKVVLRAKTKARHPYKFEIANFCIMGNHIHFLIRPARGESLSKIMQWILSVFAIHYNKIIQSKGHVWYDRFKSVLINTIRQFILVYEYISNNPIKAGLCTLSSEYRYCGAYFISKNDFRIIEKDFEL
ncbi:MAG: hypothetical protein GX469_09295 [Treponema sp.]|mgnify:FL=1|jgi:REP element-mobilizing transposase RayT|nr:hypothetical protein [Treponema sp.]OQC74371.1 MAG: Transposase IS200 like protein [Spirochaetes bacterium ADurb.Bin001]